MLISLIFSVIGLGLALLFLPLRIFGGVLGLVLIPARLVLRLFTRHIVLVLIVIAIALAYRSCSRGPDVSLPQLTPAPIGNKAPAQPVIQPVGKREDGDSQFATDLYASMTEPERTTYSYHYYYAMNQAADGRPYSWNGGNINGTLRPNDRFTTSSGTQCRHFSEVLKVHAIEQTLTGTACQQENGGWCKLKPNATPACNLGGYQPGLLDSIKKLL